MNEKDFLSWLQNENHMTIRSSRDVVSRVKRVFKLIDNNNVSLKTIDELNELDEFKKLTVTIKSQLRRSIVLYIDYCKSVRG